MNTSTIITDNLTRNYVFYFPTEAISLLESTIFKSGIPLEACNDLAFYDKDMKVSTNFKNFTLINLIGKKDILDENLLQLFEAKKSMDEKHFRFILKKYSVQIDGHLIATNWMYNNLNRIFKNVDESIVNLFKVQQEYFESHHNEFSQHFEIKKLEIFDKKERLAKYFEEKFSNPDFKIEVPDFPKNKLLTKNKTKPVKKKMILPSNEEVDRFLLRTVFNVDL